MTRPGTVCDNLNGYSNQKYFETLNVDGGPRNFSKADTINVKSYLDSRKVNSLLEVKGQTHNDQIQNSYAQ